MNLDAIEAALGGASSDGRLFRAQKDAKLPGTRAFLLS
jgi:hypothetical protein